MKLTCKDGGFNWTVKSTWFSKTLGTNDFIQQSQTCPPGLGARCKAFSILSFVRWLLVGERGLHAGIKRCDAKTARHLGLARAPCTGLVSPRNLPAQQAIWHPASLSLFVKRPSS